MHCSALNIQCLLDLSFCCVSENADLLSSSAEFGQVLKRAIVDQICRVHEIRSLCSRTCLVNHQVHCSLWENEPGSNSVHNVGVCSSAALEQNPVQDTLAASLVHSQSCRMKSTVEMN